MAKKKPVAANGQSEGFTAYSPDSYAGIGLDELVAFSVHLLSSKTVEITFENLVAECFTSFPERFALRGYPQWPDSSVVGKSLWRARTDKNYVSGTVKTGFKLTPLGVKIVEKVGDMLGQPRLKGRELYETRTRAGAVLRTLQQSRAFQKFNAAGSPDGITEYEFIDMLLCPPDASSKSLKRSLDYFKSSAKLYDDRRISDFLEAVAKKFSSLLAGKPTK